MNTNTLQKWVEEIVREALDEAGVPDMVKEEVGKQIRDMVDSELENM